MSKTTDFILNNPGKNFDGSDYKEPVINEPETLPLFRPGMSKAEILALAAASVTNCIEYGNVLEVAQALSAMDEFVGLVRKNDIFINAVVDEVSKEKGKLSINGAKIEVCETGTKYDYSQNSEWVELSRQEKEIAEKRKAIEDKLKTIPAGKLLVDEETGDSWVGASKSSKTNYKLTLAK